VQAFRGRRGSYTLERPSPLLQAHLDRYGSDEEEISRKDMSQHKRSPVPLSSPGLGKFLSSREASQRPATAALREAVLQRYLGSLAEKPVQLSLVNLASPQPAAPREIQTASSFPGTLNH
jgi:hypothetical protein